VRPAVLGAGALEPGELCSAVRAFREPAALTSRR